MRSTSFRIGTRLLLMCALTAVSLTGLRSFNQDMSAITLSRVPMLLDLHQMIGVTRAQAVMERDALISKDPQVVAANLQSIGAGHEALANAVSEIDRLLDTDQGKQLWARIGTERQEYLSSRAEVIRDIKAGHTDDAQQKLLSEQVPRESDYLNAVQALIDLVANQASSDRDASAASYINGRFLVMVLAVLAVTVATISSVERRIAEQRLADERRELHGLAYRDGLTGLFNRRHFDRELELQWRQDARADSAGFVAVVMVDIDAYKSYNDNYGHQSGDDCLRKVAHAIAASAKRPIDVVARYGGEEFALILPSTDERGAMEVAERIRQGVESLQLPHLACNAGIITVSIGVAAQRPSGGGDARGLVAAADTALYAAKRNGRNRTSVAQPGQLGFTWRTPA